MMNYETDAKVIGKRIRRARMDLQIREGAKVTQAMFGERVGAGRTTVLNWENGNTIPEEPRWQLVAEALGRTVEEIFGAREMATGEDAGYMKELRVLGATYSARYMAGAPARELLEIENSMIAIAEDGLRGEGTPEEDIPQLARTTVHRIKVQTNRSRAEDVDADVKKSDRV